MKFSPFHQTIQKILDIDLPSGPSIASEGRKIAGSIRIGRTAFIDEMGVDSEEGIKVPVVMGGILNQKVDDQALPVDAASNIKELDFLPCPRLENNFGNLLEYNLKDKEIS